MAVLRLALLLTCAYGATIGAQAPRRIISTSPSMTETLFALGVGDRVVAVSQFCRYPPQVAALPKIGTYLRPDVERMAQLRPDLVILHASAGGLARNLKAVRVPFISVDPAGLDSVFSSIRAIGVATGVPERAESLVGTIERRLSEIRKSVAGRRPQRVLLLVGRRPGTLSDLVAVSQGSYLSELLSIAGGVNVLSDPGLPEYPRISMETVIRLAPDVIIDAGDMEDRPNERPAREAATLALWKRQRVAAARTARVHVVLSDAFVIPGPRLVEATQTMALWLHGVRY
jgi:iron complex transport system substrate-binding protein